MKFDTEDLSLASLLYYTFQSILNTFAFGYFFGGKQERMAFHRGASFLMTLDFIYLYKTILGSYKTTLGTIQAFTGR